MKNKWIFFLAVLFILTSCDKVKKTQKKLDGTWNIIEYKVIKTSGLSYYYPAEGTMSFNNYQNEFCDYSLNMNYTEQGNNFSKIETGKITFSDHEYFQMDRLNPDGSTTIIKNARVMLITKDDLKLTFTSDERIHEFVFEK